MAMGQLSQTTQQNAAGSEELASTAEEMSSQAEELQHTMSFFNVGMVAAATPARGRATVRKAPPRGAVPLRAAPRKAHVADGEPDESQFTRF
jgi:methyl-accepting chemotaxis protein